MVDKIMRLFVCLIVATIVTVASYNYWHETNIRVTFYADSEKDLNYQIYYTIDDLTKFNEEQKVMQLVPAGSSCVKIIIPTEQITRFRLDTGSYPGKLIIKNLKISGNKTVKFIDFDKYFYSKDISNHTVNEDGSLTIISDKSDPYMVTTEELDILPGDDYNLYRILQIFCLSLIVMLVLTMLLNHEKNRNIKKI